MGVFRRASSAAAATATASNSNVVPIRTSLTAAAERVKLPNMTADHARKFISARSTAKTTWQDHAYDYYNQIGEIHYAFNMIATLVSRVHVHPVVVTDPDTAHPPQHVEDTKDLTPGIDIAAKGALTQLGGAKHTGGNTAAHDDSHDMADILRSLALNFLITGEAYLIQHPKQLSTGTAARWVVHSVDEVILSRDTMNPTISLKCNEQSTTSDYTLLPEDVFIARLWNPDPQYTSDPTSSMRAILPMCSELMLLNQAIQALVTSRMNAGALFIPDSLSVSGAPPVEETDGTQAEEENEFEEALIQAMTLPIQDPSNASSVVPLILRGPAEAGSQIKQFSFDRPFDDTLIQRADKVMDRILAGIDVPKDIVSGLSNVRYCVSDDTEALTRNGWKRHSDISEGEDILTLDHTTGMSQWQPALAINTFEVENEEMLSIEKTTHSSLTTMEHRWPVLGGKYSDTQTWKTSDTLSANDRIITAARCTDLPTEMKYSDDFVELVAWFYTEGWSYNLDQDFKAARCTDPDGLKSFIYRYMDKGGMSTRTLGYYVGKEEFGDAAETFEYHKYAGLTQSFIQGRSTTPRRRQSFADVLGFDVTELDKFFVADKRRSWAGVAQSRTANPENTNRIRALFHRLFGAEEYGHWSEGLTGDSVTFLFAPELAAPVRSVAAGADKIIDASFIQSLTAAQLQLFIDVSILADGHTTENGHSSIMQKVSERLDAIELALVLLGVPYSRSHYTDRGRDEYRVGLKNGVLVTAPSKPTRVITEYTGTVWCPTTKNQTWFARRNGKSFYTGNSNAIVVQDELLKSHVEPLTELICQTLTTTFLHPYLVSKGYSPEQAARIRLSYDPSPIVNRPNRSADAANLYASHALSASAWRRSTGFPETDAPSPTELLTRLTIERAQMSPELFESLLRVLAPNMMQEAVENSSAAQDLPPEVAQALGMSPAGGNTVPVPTAPNSPNAGEQDELDTADEIQPGGTMPPREEVS